MGHRKTENGNNLKPITFDEWIEATNKPSLPENAFTIYDVMNKKKICKGTARDFLDGQLKIGTIRKIGIFNKRMHYIPIKCQ